MDELICRDCYEEIAINSPRFTVIENTDSGQGRCDCCGAYILRGSLKNGIMIQTPQMEDAWSTDFNDQTCWFTPTCLNLFTD